MALDKIKKKSPTKLIQKTESDKTEKSDVINVKLERKTILKRSAHETKLENKIHLEPNIKKVKKNSDESEETQKVKLKKKNLEPNIKSGTDVITSGKEYGDVEENVPKSEEPRKLLKKKLKKKVAHGHIKKVKKKNNDTIKLPVVKAKVKKRKPTDKDVEKNENDTDSLTSQKPNIKLRRIYVSNLNTVTTKQKLQTFFGRYGVVSRVEFDMDMYLLKHPKDVIKYVQGFKNKTSLRAFITFEEVEDAIRALGANKFRYDTNEIKVRYLGKHINDTNFNYTVKVKKFPRYATVVDLKNAFEGVIHAKINNTFGTMNTSAILYFDSEESKQNALELLNPKVLNENVVAHNFAYHTDTHGIYVRKLPQQIQKEQVAAFFDDCGKIESLDLIQYETFSNAKILFESEVSLIKALRKNIEVQGKRLSICEIQYQNPEYKDSSRFRTTPKNIVKIKNIPAKSSSDELKKTFSPFGQIINVSISESAEDKKCCFIQFNTSDSVSKLLDMKNPKVLGQPVKIERCDCKNLFAIVAKNIPKKCTKEDIYKRFQDCGHIAHVSVLPQKNCSYAVVEFMQENAVERALKKKLKIANYEINISRKRNGTNIKDMISERDTEENSDEENNDNCEADDKENKLISDLKNESDNLANDKNDKENKDLKTIGNTDKDEEDNDNEDDNDEDEEDDDDDDDSEL